MVAYEEFSTFTPGIGSSDDQWYVVVKSLQSGRVLHRVPTGTALRASANYVGVGGIVDLIVKADGAVAWIAEDGQRGVQEEQTLGHAMNYYDVYALDANGLHELAAGTAINPTSLALGGNTLYWSNAGLAYSTTLQ
jgi:hypothetical protein